MWSRQLSLRSKMRPRNLALLSIFTGWLSRVRCISVTAHMWRVDFLILHSAWRVDHTGVTSWLAVVDLQTTQVPTRRTAPSLYLWCAALLLCTCTLGVWRAIPWISLRYNFNQEYHPIVSCRGNLLLVKRPVRGTSSRGTSFGESSFRENVLTPLGWPRWNFAEIFGIRKLESLRCLRDPAFSHFGTIPACDRRTDKQTDTRQHKPR